MGGTAHNSFVDRPGERSNKLEVELTSAGWGPRSAGWHHLDDSSDVHGLTACMGQHGLTTCMGQHGLTTCMGQLVLSCLHAMGCEGTSGILPSVSYHSCGPCSTTQKNQTQKKQLKNSACTWVAALAAHPTA